MDDTTPTPPDAVTQPPRKPLSETAKRALAEAQARRVAAQREEARAASERPKELQGPSGPEPTRYGDWETKGIVSDF